MRLAPLHLLHLISMDDFVFKLSALDVTMPEVWIDKLIEFVHTEALMNWKSKIIKLITKIDSKKGPANWHFSLKAMF
jgi:hypothetical protein